MAGIMNEGKIFQITLDAPKRPSLLISTKEDTLTLNIDDKFYERILANFSKSKNNADMDIEQARKLLNGKKVTIIIQ